MVSGDRDGGSEQADSGEPAHEGETTEQVHERVLLLGTDSVVGDVATPSTDQPRRAAGQAAEQAGQERSPQNSVTPGAPHRGQR